jgi:hypothetical protein
VHIRLEERFPKCIQNDEDSYAQIEKLITKQVQKISFSFIAEIP